MNTTGADWQSVGVAGLEHLSIESMPALELRYLDLLAAHLLGPQAPEADYTIEDGAAIVSLLFQAAMDAPAALPDLDSEDPDEALRPAREAVVDGAHRLAGTGPLGANRLAKRFLPAAVGELEQHKEDPEAQVRSLFYYGLLAIASGPENTASVETSDGLLAAFHTWDERIGQGFVPPWRIASPSPS